MKPITIPKEIANDSALSYEFLREEAIQTIQQLSETNWTDHNTHDPGITILEQVCYAITDLAYRLDYDIEDLLGNNESAYQELYSPATILTTSPVTLLDYRKVIVDIKRVRNAWLEKVTTSTIKGLYSVAIEYDDTEDALWNLEKTVQQKLQMCRGLCEDFLEIKVLDKQKIRFGGTIEISDNSEDVNQLAAEVLYCLHWNLSPAITFYTLQELQNKGKSTDEIFEGPRLTHGFIDDDELLKHHRKREIHASDMIKEIMDIENVLTVQNFAIASGSNQIKNWVFPLDTSKTPSLDYISTLDNITFKVSGLATTINKKLILELYQAKIAAFTTKKELLDEQKDRIITVGEDREIEKYFSIQEQFPANFGIGSSGLPDAVSEKRKAQSKQLTAYLTLFDQLLANYFSQTANFHKLVGFSDTNITTNFNQSLLGKVAGLEALLQNPESYANYLNENEANSSKNLKRKNKFLNHLLARYSEKFTTYSMLMQDSEEEDDVKNQQKLIKDKIAFLKAYPQISSERGKAFDYTRENKQIHYTSGLEKRIAKKLGLETAEDFYMIEHILLRPTNENSTTLETYYQSNSIGTFEVIEDSKSIKINAQNHHLIREDRIEILDAGVSLGIFKILEVSEIDFEIAGIIQNITEDSAITWQRVDPDIRFQVLTNPISSFEASSNTNATLCNTKFQLNTGDTITIFGTHNYDGTHTVTALAEGGFEIQIPFQGNKSTGRFTDLDSQTDTYSLQLTFIFPNDAGRYKNQMFKNFAENTIREETPAHLKAHIKWLSETEITSFKNAHQKFLVQMNYS